MGWARERPRASARCTSESEVRARVRFIPGVAAEHSAVNLAVKLVVLGRVPLIRVPRLGRLAVRREVKLGGPNADKVEDDHGGGCPRAAKGPRDTPTHDARGVAACAATRSPRRREQDT